MPKSAQKRQKIPEWANIAKKNCQKHKENVFKVPIMPNYKKIAKTKKIVPKSSKRIILYRCYYPRPSRDSATSICKIVLQFLLKQVDNFTILEFQSVKIT